MVKLRKNKELKIFNNIKNTNLGLLVPLIATLILVFVGLISNSQSSKIPVVTYSNLGKNNLAETTKNDYVLEGKLDIPLGTKLFINGAPVKFDNNGAFKHTINLTEGKNVVEVKIVRNGKESKGFVYVNKVAPKTDVMTPEMPVAQDDTEKDTTAQPRSTISSIKPKATTTPKPSEVPQPTPTPKPAIR